MSISWVRQLFGGRDKPLDFDAKYGTETGAGVTLDNLTIGHDSRRFGERYQASDPKVLIDSVKFMGIAPAGHRFIDLGCGKGRMLIVAAELGFKSCVGVEFADELAATATKNVAASGFKTIDLVHGDAGSYRFGDEPFVLYMFNPFAAQVMERVRGNLMKLKRARYAVIYKNARERQIFDAMPTLRYIGSPPTQQGLSAVHIWLPRD